MTAAAPPEKMTNHELAVWLKRLSDLDYDMLPQHRRKLCEAARRLSAPAPAAPRVGDLRERIARIIDPDAFPDLPGHGPNSDCPQCLSTAAAVYKRVDAILALYAPPAASADEPPAFDDATLTEFARECAEIGNRMPHKLKLVALAKDWLALREANQQLMNAVLDYALDEVAREHFARYRPAPKGEDDMRWICRLLERLFRCNPRGRANALLVYARTKEGKMLMSKFAFVVGEKGLHVSIVGFNTKSGKTDALVGVPVWANDNAAQPMVVAADGLSADFAGTGAPTSGNIHVTAEGDATPGVDPLFTDFIVAETAEEADSLQVTATPLT